MVSSVSSRSGEATNNDREKVARSGPKATLGLGHRLPARTMVSSDAETRFSKLGINRF